MIIQRLAGVRGRGDPGGAGSAEEAPRTATRAEINRQRLTDH
jgi:hypothetical protein